MRAQGVTLLVAGPGYGKSARVEAALSEDGQVFYADRVTPSKVRACLNDSPVAIAIEDLHRLDVERQADLVAAVAETRGRTDVLLTSRLPLGPKARAALTCPVFERGPIDLALTPGDVATLLIDEYSVADAELPSLIHQATAGWPSLVHLVADSCARVTPRRGHTFLGALDELMDGLLSPGTGVRPWVENSLLADWPDEVVAMVTTLADHDVVTVELASALWGESQEASWLHRAYAEARQGGLLVPHPRASAVGRPAERVVPIVAAHLRQRPTVADLQLLRRAAEWFETHGYPFAALHAWERADDASRADAVLVAHGQRMLAQGDAGGLLAVLDRRSTDAGGHAEAHSQRLAGRAQLLTGRVGEALGTLTPLVRAVGDAPWPVELALDVASVHFTKCDFALVRETLDRVPTSSLPTTGVGIRWRALQVMAEMTLGEKETATRWAREALACAEESGDRGDLAHAHLAMARISPMTHRKIAHLEEAASCARAAGDAITLAGVLCTQTYTLLAATDFADAVRVGQEAVAVSELVRPMGALTAALHNLAEALCRVGRYDEAHFHLRRAASVARRLGGGRSASSFSGLGDLYLARGQREQGVDAYNEAISLARESGELQVLVPALCGLARLSAYDDPDTARASAEDALRLAPASMRAGALTARAVVDIAAGAHGSARTFATEAVTAAREEHALDLLADALEALAVAADDPVISRDLLLEAWSIWRDAGADPNASRILVRLARQEGADRETLDRGRAAAAHLLRLGVTRFDGRPVADDPMGKDVQIRVLGGFEVTVGGRPVAMQTWKSRQARTLVKLLSARRGRPASRGLLCECLWPDDDPAKTSHRLSVLLATVRSVLDPGKLRPPDHYIASDNRGVWLDLRRVSVDAHELIGDADHAAELMARGREGEAAALMGAIDRRYRGDAFEDEPYEMWASDLRDEVRTAWLRSQRQLATIATRERRHSDTVAILSRLLRVDPYDEKVHHGLVRTLARSGRYGEARRAFDAWVAAMAAVDAPVPDPSVLAPRPALARQLAPDPA